MTTYQKFKALPIDHAAIGLGQSDTQTTYYCTPKDARILGWAGVDGIHYCTIPEFGETVFAVSPMNLGDCVHPIARNFQELLSLLLSCADMAALEQCYAWDEEQFKAFLTDCPPTEAQREVLDTLRREFSLEPIEDAFAYVKQLQAGFDLSRIPYTEDYYDPDMNAAAPVRPVQWKVTYDGGFGSSEGNAGFEVPIRKTFFWGSEAWHIPAVYICDKGLVIDYCMEAEPAAVTAFIEKWDLSRGERNHYTREQQEQIQREHPLNVHFFGKVTLNGHALQSGQGTSISWLPASCLPKSIQPRTDAEFVLEHYGLDRSRAWSLHRWSYCWGETNGLDMQSLSVRMERQPENIPGAHFLTPAVGESIPLTHPVTGAPYVLTVHEVERQELSADTFRDPGMEYPNHFLAMSYSLEPDIAGRSFLLQDRAEGDSPRPKKRDPNAAQAGAMSIGIIGGADGPTAIIMGGSTPKLHAACSALRFQPADEVEWRPVFSVKQLEDVEIRLI